MFDEELVHVSSVIPRSPWRFQEYKSLLTTLYIGEHRHGLYALPGLVEKNSVPIIKPREGGGRLMIDGPHSNDNGPNANTRPDSIQPEDAIEGEGNRVEVVRPETIIEDDDNENTPPTTSTTPGTTFVLVLGHHEVPERMRSKFSPHFGVPDDPHVNQRMKEMDRITQEAHKAVYPAIKNAEDTPFPLLEAGKEEESNGPRKQKEQDLPSPTVR